MSCACFSLRGTMRARNGLSFLAWGDLQKRDWESNLLATYVVIPGAHSRWGKNSFPVAGSMGGKISKAARIFEMTSHASASARNRPGQILDVQLVSHAGHVSDTLIIPSSKAKNQGSRVVRTKCLQLLNAVTLWCVRLRNEAVWIVSVCIRKVLLVMHHRPEIQLAKLLKTLSIFLSYQIL